MSTATDLKTAMTTERERLLRLIAGVSEQQFKKRPDPTAADPQPWSIAEVLAHLLATEQLWTRRIAQVLDNPESTLTPADDAAHQATARAGRGAPVPQLIHGLLAARRELERLVDRVAAADGLDRAGNHPSRGRLTIGWMLENYAIGHEREHSAQIAALRVAVGAPVAAAEAL